MRIIVLGCGGSAGVPMLGGADGAGDWGVCDPAEPRNRRSRSSILIEGDDGKRILVDTGPELREQLIRCRIGRVDAVLYSHAHADHVAGLDEIRSLNRIVDRPIDTFATRPVLDEIAHRFSYAFRPWTPPNFYRPVMIEREIRAGETVDIEGLSILLFEQTHGHSVTLGLRIGAFAYSTDVVRLNDEALDALRGTDTWIVDCFQRKAHPAHADVEQVRRWSRQLGIRRTILTHMGTDMDWSWMLQNLPKGLEPAFDGMQILV